MDVEDMDLTNVIDWGRRSVRARSAPERYWDEYVAKDPWYVEKLLEDVPRDEVYAACFDENFEFDDIEDDESSDESSDAEEDAAMTPIEEQSERATSASTLSDTLSEANYESFSDESSDDEFSAETSNKGEENPQYSSS
eukprot:1297042-Pleurochrysis_carterae.AAC.1